jgi:outer membrane receptor protein involved in Fe transport
MATSVFAQQPMLEEVVITAQKRAQSLMDVPISVSAVGGEKMIEAGIKDLGDLSAYVPNFNKSDTSIGQILSIRGISSGLNRGFEQSVVQYTDDVALTRGVLARAPFMDLERVEVLRGPQNVLFGKNSIAGALSFTTVKPSDEFEGSVGVEYRDEDSAKQLDAMISGPITDAVRGRLVVRGLDSDGFHENNLTGADDDGAREELAVRLTLGMDLTDNIDATLKLERSTFDMDGRGDELIGGYTDPASGLGYADVGNAFLTPLGMGSDDGLANRRRNTNVQETSENEVDNITFTLNWDLGGITMTSVTAYLAYDQEEYLDVDGSGFNFLVSDKTEEFSQFSQEIRFVSPGGETIDWIAGAYYQNWDLETRTTTPLEVDGPGYALAAIGAGAILGYHQTKDFDSASDTYAAFAQATWNMSDTWRLTLGGRYTVEDKEAQRFLDMSNTTTGSMNPGFGAGSACPSLNADLCAMVTGRIAFGQDYNSLGEFDASVGGALGGILGIPLNTHDFDEDRSESSFTPTVILEWDATDTTMAYVNLSSGFKAGGFDGQGSLGDPDLFEFEEETVNSAEIGFKSSLAGGAAELNGAFFYVQYDDLQVSVFDGLVGFVVDNAAEAVTMGVELDGRWAVTDGLTLSGSAGYLDFEFKDWPEAQCSAGLILAGDTNPDGKTCDYSGRQNIFTPEFTASLSADYRMSLTDSIDLHAVLDVNYKGSQYVEPTLDDSIKEDAVTQVNARIALETGNWTLALVGKNLTDEDSYSYITETPLSASVTRAVLGTGYAAYTGYQEPPRTIAVQAIYRF